MVFSFMESEAKQWRIFRCPSCETMLKVSKDSTARTLKCPKCSKTVKLPDPGVDSGSGSTGRLATATAAKAPSSGGSVFAQPPGGPEKSEEPAKGDFEQQPDGGVLPEQREFDPTPEGLKEARENWELQRHKRKKIEFADKLATTKDEDFQIDPNAEPIMKRRRFVGGGGGETVPSWEDDEGIGSSGRKSNLPMIIMLAAAMLLGATALLASIMMKGKGGESLFTGIFKRAPESNLAKSLDPADFYDEVSLVIKNFLNAESVDELVGYIREPERVAPILRQYYRERAPYTKVPYAKLPDPGSLQAHLQYMISVIEIEGQKPRIMALEQTETGFKVDWESWVGYSKITWDLFVDLRMIDPNEFRALIGRDDYYNYKFSDFLQYRCYQIRDPEEKHQLWGYVERNGPIDKKLQRAMLRTPYAFVVVKLRFPEVNPEDKRNSQVEIVELVEEGWVLRSDNDDDPDAYKLDGPFGFDAPATEEK